MKRLLEIINKYRRKVNKYWLTLIVFMIVTFFLGDSTILDRISYNKQINNLEEEIEFYTKEKEKNLEKLDAIQSDVESLEKFAREQYLMTRQGEELFIISE
jgi:cell division protein FtsB